MHKADQVCQSIDAHILRYICSSFLLNVTGGLVMPSQHTGVQPWGVVIAYKIPNILDSNGSVAQGIDGWVEAIHKWFEFGIDNIY